MKSKLFLLLITSFMLVSCTNATNEASQSNTSENTESGSSTSSQKESTCGGWAGLKVDFYNNSSFSTGKILDNKEAFITAFNNGEKSGDLHGDFLSDISCNDKEKVQIANNTSDVCHINSILQLGTRTGAGELTLHFNSSPIVWVKIVAQAYWTCYQYGQNPVTYSVDEYANICVGNDENYIDLSCEASGEPELITREYELKCVHELKLYDIMNQDPLPDKQGQRVYIHSLEVKTVW